HDDVVADIGHHRVRGDAHVAAVHDAAAHLAHPVLHREREVDPLRAGRRLDHAVADHHAAPARVNPVLARAGDADVVQHDVARILDVDHVASADNGYVTDRHVVRGHD